MAFRLMALICLGPAGICWRYLLMTAISSPNVLISSTAKNDWRMTRL
uniref:Uncharacterized protein n=1 Tax=Anguilla anguilla TaxID=7936 RepID=A0A0E9T241_ANGAN